MVKSFNDHPDTADYSTICPRLSVLMSSAPIPRCPLLPGTQIPDKNGISPLQAVGHCYFEWRKFATAMTEYQRAQGILENERPPCEQTAKQSIDTQIIEAKRSVATLRLSLAQEDRKLPDLTVMIDGSPQKVDSWPIVVYVDPGMHTIEVSARDRVAKKESQKIDVVPNWQLNSPQADASISITPLQWAQATRVTKLFIDVDAQDITRPGLVVSLDGNPVATWPQEVLPGDHRIVEIAPDMLPWDEIITVPEPKTPANPGRGDYPSYHFGLSPLSLATAYHTKYTVRLDPDDQLRPGLTVRIDGHQSAGNRFDLKGQEEDHVLYVSARRCAPWEHKISIKAPPTWRAGDPIPDSTLGISVPPLVCVSPDSGGSQWIMAGVITSVGLGIVGASLLAYGRDWEDNLRRSCHNPGEGTGCPVSIRDEKENSKNLILAGDGLLLVTAVAAALTGSYAGYLRFYAPPSATDKTSSFRFFVAPVRTGVNVGLSGEF